MSSYCDETYDVYHERPTRARKPHVCAACKETIAVGRRYMSVRTVFDGLAQTIKRCMRCQSIHEHLRTLDHDGELWPDERLNCGEEYKAHWGVEPPEYIAAMAFALPAEVDSVEAIQRGLRALNGVPRATERAKREGGGVDTAGVEVSQLRTCVAQLRRRLARAEALATQLWEDGDDVDATYAEKFRAALAPSAEDS